VGGGTGWVLEELCKVCPRGLDIVYVEVSAKMLQLSKKRNAGFNNIVFIQQAVEDADIKGGFDVILTGFLFDNFAVAKAQQVFKQLDGWLKPSGLWLFADFTMGGATGRFWQKAFLWAMYFFFRLVCKIEARWLTDMRPIFNSAGYREDLSKNFYGHFIYSVVYQKPTQVVVDTAGQDVDGRL
jgi:ubiquinone/menaquinone biosynthesis C-methylase UbiE